MLEIELEFRKGILFVRLGGILNKKTISGFNKEVTSLIKETGIRNVVFNMTNLKEIDIDDIEEVYNNYKFSHENHGNTLVCGLEDCEIKRHILRSRLMKNIGKTKGEIEAVNLINT